MPVEVGVSKYLRAGTRTSLNSSSLTWALNVTNLPDYFYYISGRALDPESNRDRFYRYETSITAIAMKIS